MKRPILFTTALLASGLLLAGCTAAEAETATVAPNIEVSEEQPVAAATVVSDYDLAPSAVMAENDDYTTVNLDEWSESDAVEVKLSGSGIAGAVDGVTASGGTVTITEAGVYRLSGSLSGQLIVEAPEDALVVLLLDGASIDSTTGAAIEVRTADDVAIHLASGSENSVSDAASYAEDAEANAAIYSDADLTITGDGSLTVTGNGNDGITSKDDLVILGGDITVVAADDALRGKDSLVVEGGTLSLTAHAGDGMKSDQDNDWTRGYIYVRGGTIDIVAGDDGLQAFTDTVIAAGIVTVAAADDGVKGEVIVSIGQETEVPTSVVVTASTEGIEAANIGISGGVVDVTASDDGINASGNAELQALIAGVEFTGIANREADTGERLEISGGRVTIRAGSDGLDSNGAITITGGELTITSAGNGGDGPLDANGAISVADGVTIMANGVAWDSSTAGGMGGPGGGFGGPGGGGFGGSGGPGGQPPM